MPVILRTVAITIVLKLALRSMTTNVVTPAFGMCYGNIIHNHDLILHS